MTIDKASKLISWAELHEIDYDIYNLAEIMLGETKEVKLGLDAWPEELEVLVKETE